MYILFQVVDNPLVIRIGQRSATQRRSDDGCSLVFGNQLEDRPRQGSLGKKMYGRTVGLEVAIKALGQVLQGLKGVDGNMLATVQRKIIPLLRQRSMRGMQACAEEHVVGPFKHG